MKNVGDLFLKYKNLIISEESVRVTISEITSKLLKRQIPIESIVIKNGIISFKISPIEKQELFFKQELLLTEIQTQLPHAHIVRFK
jgi:hypothetical protein